MTTEYLAPAPVFRANDNNGNLLSGGQLFTYAAGTTTPLATYTDSTGTTPNANPVILNTRGEASVWIPPGIGYKFVLSPATDTNPPTNPFWTQDQIFLAPVLPNPSSSNELNFPQVNAGGTAYQLISAAALLTAIGAAPATGGDYAAPQLFGGILNSNTVLSSAETTTTYEVGNGATAPFGITLPAPSANLRFRFIGNSSTPANACFLTTASGAIITPDGVVQALPWAGNIHLSGTTTEVFADGSAWIVTNLSGQNLERAAVNPNQAPQWGQVLGGASAAGVPAVMNNVKTSRALGSTYTNNNGKPIWVIMSAFTTSAGSGQIVGTINGVDVANQSATEFASTFETVTLLVPPGATYGFTGSNMTLNTWNEYF